MNATRHNSAHPQRTAARLFESLERRVLLCGQFAPTVWTGLGDGVHWHDPSNWDTGHVPGILDHVVIQRHSGTRSDPIRVTEPAAACTIESNTAIDVIKSMTIFRDSHFEAPIHVHGEFSIVPDGDVVVRMVSLTMDDHARFDIANATLIIDYTDFSPLERLMTPLETGFHRGLGGDRGIVSSFAVEHGIGAVGYAEAEDLFSGFPRSFAGSDIDETTLIIRYTLGGDANLDRVVDLADFLRLASTYGRPQDVVPTWSEGNFNYDGATNLADFNILAANFGQSMPDILPLRGASDSPFADRRLDIGAERAIEALEELA